jgi:acyl carrier protein
MTWNREAVHVKVIELFTKHGKVEVDESTQIIADLGIDSLGVMEVFAEVEDTYKLLIPDEALRNIETVGDVVNAIVERLAQDGRLSE